MTHHPEFELTPAQEAAADRFVDTGQGSYDDWRRSEGVEPIGQAQIPSGASNAAKLSLRAMTAPGAAEHAAVIEELGHPQADDNGTEYTH